MTFPTVFDDRFLVTGGGWTVTRWTVTRDDDEPTAGWLMLDARDRLDDPDRDLATDPADEEARRWEREMARADVARRDP